MKQNHTEKKDVCSVCEQPLKDCVCCEACGHVCPRDHGETWCPVCFPEPAAADAPQQEKAASGLHR